MQNLSISSSYEDPGSICWFAAYFLNVKMCYQRLAFFEHLHKNGGIAGHTERKVHQGCILLKLF